MFERLAAACLTGYAVWHACRRKPRWADHLRDDDLAYRVVYRPHYYVDRDLSNWINADIGGRVGLGYQTVGYRGGSARY